MPKVNLTKRLVEQIPPAQKTISYWDANVTGLHLKVTPAGKKSFYVHFRVLGRERRPKLGEFGVLTIDQARKRALEMLAEASAGRDLVASRVDARNLPRLIDLWERYDAQFLETGRRRPATVSEYRRLMERDVLPRFGSHRVCEIDRQDIEQLQQSMRTRPYQANRTLAVLSKLMNMAEKWGMRSVGSNPTKHVERYPEKSRERFLSPREIGNLGRTLLDAERLCTESIETISAIRFLLLTGCRLNEALQLKWEFICWDRKLIELPDSKTGAKSIQLNKDVAELLQSMTPVGRNPYVFPGRNVGQHLVNLQKPWRRIRKKAGLDDVRLHDLRHTYAATSVTLGGSLPLLGRLLGHSQAQTTQRYAHVANDPAIEHANSISNSLTQLLGQPSADNDANEDNNVGGKVSK